MKPRFAYRPGSGYYRVLAWAQPPAEGDLARIGPFETLDAAWEFWFSPGAPDSSVAGHFNCSGRYVMPLGRPAAGTA